MRAGDHVRHTPSGETWVVRSVEPEQNRLSWCGWPPGTALLSDCELVYSCSDAEHEKLVADLRKSTTN